MVEAKSLFKNGHLQNCLKAPYELNLAFEPLQDTQSFFHQTLMPPDTDPLMRLRHALAGIAVALLMSVMVAALLGRFLGDALGDSYSLRAGIYAGLLLYVLVGAVVLFVKVAKFETRRLSAARALLWLASLWLWPVLLLRRGGAAKPP